MRENEIVVDASVVLAALKNERFDKFEPRRVVGATISAVNLSEVLVKLAADGLTGAQADAATSSLQLRVLPFDRQQAGIAANFWPATRRAGLSLGDRACLALGKSLGCLVVTADEVWSRLDLGVEVALIR